MKLFKSLSAILILMISILAQAENHKVVFEITSDDKKDWETLLNNLENVRKELGSKTEMEVVAHGGGISLVLKKSDFQTKRMLKISQQGVKFLGCENTMKRKNINHNELHAFVGTVPAGLAEIIRKQSQGWAYIKIGH